MRYSAILLSDRLFARAISRSLSLVDIFINKILSVVIGGNPLPLGGGRSPVSLYLLTLAFNVLLYGS